MLRNISAFLLLTALNLSICWRLFKVEYTAHFASIEGSFIAIARYLSRHWGDFSWWPLWHCGMPYQDTYVPLLHVAVAATASLMHLSPARAYHGVTAVTYALGPATLYLMAVRLGARRGAAFLAALFYSLFSPSALFLPGVARDIGGLWYARRLQVLAYYGEGPHVSAMTLLPVAILALENALVRRTRRAFAFAALAIALVFLTNVPGTMALGLAVFCWICAQHADRVAAAWKTAAGASLLAYGVACFGIPPSSLLTVGGNIGAMHAGFSNSLKHGPALLILVLGAVAAAGYGLARTRIPLLLRFAILFFGLLASLAVTANSNVFELLPQVRRLHLEAEMGACLLLGWAAWTVYSLLPRWTCPIVLAICLAPIVVQWRNYRSTARDNITYADLSKHSEYTTARWLDRNANGARVWAGGSTSFWLNSFTDTPQVVGCCDQGLDMPVLSYAPYFVNDRHSSPQLAQEWLQALGAQALVVNGANSTDAYKDIQAPERYRGVLPVLHEENGDTIYAVSSAPASLVHVVRPGEPVPVPPRGQKIPDSRIVRYAQALAAPARPAAAAPWLRGRDANVRGRPAPLSADGLGFLLIHPRCQGDCEITLRWTGSPDYWFAAALSLASLAFAMWMLVKPGLPDM